MGCSYLFCSQLFALIGCAQPHDVDTSNISCVKKLLIPEYPALAQSSRLSMSISAVVMLDDDGRVESVSFKDASDARTEKQSLFAPTIERTIRQSEFESTCARKTMRISYGFRMNAVKDVTASWFGYPNRVEVWAVSPYL